MSWSASPPEPGREAAVPEEAWPICAQCLHSGKGFAKTKALRRRPSCPVRLPGWQISMETTEAQLFLLTSQASLRVCNVGAWSLSEHLPRPRQRPRLGPLPHGEDEKEGRLCPPQEKGILEDRARCSVPEGPWCRPVQFLGPLGVWGGGPPQTALCQFRPVPGGRGSSFWWDQSWDPGFSSPEAKASLWPSDAFSICFSLSFPILKYS